MREIVLVETMTRSVFLAEVIGLPDQEKCSG